MRNIKKSWDRFAQKDAVLFILAGASGCVISFAMRSGAQESPLSIPPWPAHAKWLELIVVGIILGSAIAAPLILLSQFIFGKRRKKLSIAEYLWLGPLCTYIVVYLSSQISPSIFWFFLFICGVMFCACASIVVILVAAFFRGTFDMQPCLWTNLFGAVSCISNGALLIYTLIVDPISNIPI